MPRMGGGTAQFVGFPSRQWKTGGIKGILEMGFGFSRSSPGLGAETQEKIPKGPGSSSSFSRVFRGCCPILGREEGMFQLEGAGWEGRREQGILERLGGKGP